MRRTHHHQLRQKMEISSPPSCESRQLPPFHVYLHRDDTVKSENLMVAVLTELTHMIHYGYVPRCT